MYKKNITYTDFNGTERTEDFYFNFTNAELAEMQLEADGALEERINRIIKSKNVKEIAENFKFILTKAYGVKSEDGRRFMKSDEILKEFTETQAFSDYYMMLATDADEAARFVNNVIPQTKETKPIVVKD